MSNDKPNTLTVRAYVDPVQLAKDIAYSVNDISGAMADQAALAVNYGILHSKTERQVNSLELVLEIKEAQVDKAIRKEALEAAKAEFEAEKAAGNSKAKIEKSMTETQIAKMVASHPDVVRVRVALLEAREIKALALTAVNSFRQRRDMLVSEGLRQRDERKGDMSINARNEANQAQQDQTDRVRHRLAQTFAAREN